MHSNQSVVEGSAVPPFARISVWIALVLSVAGGLILLLPFFGVPMVPTAPRSTALLMVMSCFGLAGFMYALLKIFPSDD
jgi:peptidoglycan/LPS O-acetylase OafA/YrhL